MYTLLIGSQEVEITKTRMGWRAVVRVKQPDNGGGVLGIGLLAELQPDGKRIALLCRDLYKRCARGNIYFRCDQKRISKTI